MRQAAVLIFMRSFTISSKRDQIHSLHPTSATILLNETKKCISGIQARVSRGHLLHAVRGTSASVYSRNDRSYNDEAIGREKNRGGVSVSSGRVAELRDFALERAEGPD